MILTHFGGEDAVDLTRTYVQDHHGLGTTHGKPRGLWLSDESDYGWAEWCRDENFVDTDQQVATSFTLSRSAHVLHLSTFEMVRDLPKQYPIEFGRYAGDPLSEGGVDWLRIVAEYDGILITPYQWSARLRHECGYYYGWDVASGCFWNLRALTPVAKTLAPA